MRNTGKQGRISWPALVALALVPILAVAGLLGLATRDDAAIEAAVVNLDEAVTIDGQYVPMGRQLAAAMVDREGDNISWTLADAPSAAAGLESGRFSAVVTIPKGFSAAATSFSANDAATAKQASITVQTSDNSPITDAAVAQQIARLATDTINSTLTESYLDGIYIGFNTVGEQFTTIVDGAKQLHDGATGLADGAKQASQGTTQLSDGLGLLKSNSAQLVSGGTQLVSGIGELGSGSDQLADGLAQFASQTPALVQGVETLAEGADQLLSQVPAYADGAAQAIGGVTQLRQGLDQAVAGLDQPIDTSDLDRLAAGARQSATGAQGLSDGLGELDGVLGGYASGDIAPPAAVQTQLDGIAAQFGCADPSADPACARIVAALSAGFQVGTGTASGALNTPGAGGSSVLDGAQALAAGSDQIATGVETLATELPEQTAEQLAELKDGLTQLRDGAATLEQQAQPIVDNAPALGSGATQLLGGIEQLNSQVGALPDGVNQLATGARQLADGVGTLETGAAAYTDGVAQYAQGVGTAADGSTELAAGMIELSDGAAQLNDGLGTFASELAKGADQVPSYSQSQRQRLSTVVASPIENPDSLIGNGAVATVSLLLVAGLWLGALASFVVARPIPRTVVTSRAPSVALWARSLWLPMAIVVGQAVVLGVVGGVVLEIGVGKTVGLAALLVVAGASFVLANHALAAWFGNVGRAISVLLLIATVGLGLSSAAGWLAPVGAVSPLHNAFLLVRTWLAGGSGEIGLASVAILMFAIAAVASVMSISARRRLTAAQFRTVAA